MSFALSETTKTGFVAARPENRKNRIKVSKGAKIRNQVPHLTKDANGKVKNSQLDPTSESQEVILSQQVTTGHIPPWNGQ